MDRRAPSARAATLAMPGLSVTVGEQIAALQRVAGDKRRRAHPARARPDHRRDRRRLAARFRRRSARSQLGFTTAEKSFEDIIRIHIEDELGGKFVDLKRCHDDDNRQHWRMHDRAASDAGCRHPSSRYSYGGDTLNTAVYLAAAWRGRGLHHGARQRSAQRRDDRGLEGRGHRHRARDARCKGKLPGLYAIRDQQGAASAASITGARPRPCGAADDLPETDAILAALADYDMIYLSGITLSLFDVESRHRLIAALLSERAVQASASPSIPISARGELARSRSGARRVSGCFCGPDIARLGRGDHKIAALSPARPRKSCCRREEKPDSGAWGSAIAPRLSDLWHNGQRAACRGRAGDYPSWWVDTTAVPATVLPLPILHARSGAGRPFRRRRTGRSLSRRHWSSAIPARSSRARGDARYDRVRYTPIS